VSRFAYERAIRRSELPPPARHIALTAATWADIATGVIPERFQPSIAKLAETTGLHEATVKRHLKTLVAEGWMIRDVRRQDGRLEHDIARTTLTIPASAQGEDDGEVGAQSANPPKEVGAERAEGGRTERQEVGAERAEGGRTERHKSPLSSGSTYQSPRAGASEDRTGPGPDRRDGTTKTTSITEDLDAAADAARVELSRAARREITTAWARRVAIGILDAAGGPVERPAGYVRAAIRNEADITRFLPTATSSSNTHEAFTEPDHAPPALTLHTGTGRPRRTRTSSQPPLMTSVPDTAPVTGPSAEEVRRHAAAIRAQLAERRMGETS
jgi:hypothetical protein